jgi:hypothetical protein
VQHAPKERKKYSSEWHQKHQQRSQEKPFLLGIYSVFDKIKASTPPKMANHGPNMVPMWPKMAQDKP